MKTSPAGFTLIEVLIALAIVAVTATGVAVLFGLATRTIATARMRTTAVLLASQKLEQLRALTWGLAGDPAVATTDSTTDLSVDPPTGGGQGLGASPAGTLQTNVAGYVDFLDRYGRWAGTGPTPPPAAVFVRRWSATPLARSPSQTVALQVYVTTVVREGTGGFRRPGRSAAPDAALVATLKTRTLR